LGLDTWVNRYRARSVTPTYFVSLGEGSKGRKNGAGEGMARLDLDTWVNRYRARSVTPTYFVRLGGGRGEWREEKWGGRRNEAEGEKCITPRFYRREQGKGGRRNFRSRKFRRYVGRSIEVNIQSLVFFMEMIGG
jgi:hypothetical protein